MQQSTYCTELMCYQTFILIMIQANSATLVFTMFRYHCIPKSKKKSCSMEYFDLTHLNEGFCLSSEWYKITKTRHLCHVMFYCRNENIEVRVLISLALSILIIFYNTGSTVAALTHASCI